MRRCALPFLSNQQEDIPWRETRRGLGLWKNIALGMWWQESGVVYLSFVDLYYCVCFAIELLYNCVQKASFW